jgi:autotransporter passenger strand-loop-strand repeat protein
VLSSGTEQTVLSGGTAINTIILSGASAVINGGTTSDTTITSGGLEIAVAGTLTNTTIQAGGTLVALPGATLNGLVNEGGTLLSGGIITIAASSTFTFDSPNGSGATVVDILSYTPPPALVTDLVIDGTQTVLKPVTTLQNGTTFVGAGTEPTTYILSGGSAATVESDGYLVVAAGGQVTSVSDYAAFNGSMTVGTLAIESGGFASFVTLYGGVVDFQAGAALSGGTAAGFLYTEEVDGPNNTSALQTFSQYGKLMVDAGAVLSGFVVNALGALDVAGTADATQVFDGGTINVTGGLTTGTTLTAGNYQSAVETIYGGIASNTNVGTHGYECLSAGSAVDTQIAFNAGANIIVTGGELLSAHALGGQIVVSAGIASATQLGGNANQTVYQGGLAISSYISGTAETVAGGVTSGSYTGSQGEENVYSGGRTYDAIISGGYATETVNSGTAYATSVYGGGSLIIYAGSSVNALIGAGGQENVAAGTADNTAVESGGKLTVAGRLAVASGATISEAGYLYAGQSGTVDNATIASGGVADFDDGATGNNLIVSSGGTAIMYYSAGHPFGTLSGVTIESGGTLLVSAGAIFTSLTGVVSAGGVVELGGVVVSGVTSSTAGPLTAPVTTGGLLIQAGGLITDAAPVIAAGGVLTISSGATVYNAQIANDGTLVVNAGGTAIDNAEGDNPNVINNGALLFEPLPTNDGAAPATLNTALRGTVTGTGSIIVAGSTHLAIAGVNELTGGTTIGTGATLEIGGVGGNGLGAGTVSFGSNAELVIDYYGQNNITFGNVLDGLTAGDQIFLGAIGYNGADTLNVSGNILTVTDGGFTESLQLGGTSLDNQFVLSTISDNAIITVAPLQITSGFTITAGAVASNPTIGTGGDAVVSAGGTVSAPVIAGGTLELAAGSTLTGNISFAGPGRLVVDGTVPTNTITGFVPGDSVKLAGVPYDPADMVVVNTPGVVTIETPGGDYNLNVAGAFVGETGFNVAGDLLLTQNALCYQRGTHILTPSGERLVEELRIGDKVVTRFSGIQPIKWIGRQNYAARFVANNPAKMPVRIAAGAFEPSVPARDLYVSPGHALLLDDVLVLASRLVNGLTITQPKPAAEVNYYQIELATHDCLIAEGSWAKSYADAPGMRAQFHNQAEYDALYPDEPPPDELTLCAPRPERGRKLEAALRTPAWRASAGITPGPLEGYLDHVDAWTVAGWAMDIDHPRLPVLLDIWLGDAKLGDALACTYRGDLAAAGKGTGHCAFTFTPPRRLPAAAWQTLRVTRAADAASLRNAADLRQAIG